MCVSWECGDEQRPWLGVVAGFPNVRGHPVASKSSCGFLAQPAGSFRSFVLSPVIGVIGEGVGPTRAGFHGLRLQPLGERTSNNGREAVSRDGGRRHPVEWAYANVEVGDVWGLRVRVGPYEIHA